MINTHQNYLIHGMVQSFKENIDGKRFLNVIDKKVMLIALFIFAGLTLAYHCFKAKSAPPFK